MPWIAVMRCYCCIGGRRSIGLIPGTIRLRGLIGLNGLLAVTTLFFMRRLGGGRRDTSGRGESLC